jgi:hypothetical protein
MKRSLQTIVLALIAVPAAAGPLAVTPAPTAAKTPAAVSNAVKKTTPRPSAPVPVSSLAVKSGTGSSHAKVTKPRSDLANAQRAMDAAKQFLSKAPNDPAGHRLKAQQALETALTEVTAALGPHAAK